MNSLPDFLKERLAGEYRYAASRMKESRDPREVMYFFSVTFGEATRILNWHWDRNLALIHFVTQQAQRQISARLQSISQGTEVMDLPGDFFSDLASITDQLADYVEGEQDETTLLGLMSHLSELAYLTTGNGFYLMERGRINADGSST